MSIIGNLTTSWSKALDINFSSYETPSLLTVLPANQVAAFTGNGFGFEAAGLNLNEDSYRSNLYGDSTIRSDNSFDLEENPFNVEENRSSGFQVGTTFENNTSDLFNPWQPGPIGNPSANTFAVENETNAIINPPPNPPSMSQPLALLPLPETLTPLLIPGSIYPGSPAGIDTGIEFAEGVPDPLQAQVNNFTRTLYEFDKIRTYNVKFGLEKDFLAKTGSPVQYQQFPPSELFPFGRDTITLDYDYGLTLMNHTQHEVGFYDLNNNMEFTPFGWDGLAHEFHHAVQFNDEYIELYHPFLNDEQLATEFTDKHFRASTTGTRRGVYQNGTIDPNTSNPNFFPFPKSYEDPHPPNSGTVRSLNFGLEGFEHDILSTNYNTSSAFEPTVSPTASILSPDTISTAEPLTYSFGTIGSGTFDLGVFEF